MAGESCSVFYFAWPQLAQLSQLQRHAAVHCKSHVATGVSWVATHSTGVIMSTHDININLNISLTVHTDGSVSVAGVSTQDQSAVGASPDSAVGEPAEPLGADELRELAAPYKKSFVISRKELEALTKDEIIALGQGMLGVDIYKRQHKDDIIAEFWREYRARN